MSYGDNNFLVNDSKIFENQSVKDSGLEEEFEIVMNGRYEWEYLPGFDGL